jgi:hypothetical protein
MLYTPPSKWMHETPLGTFGVSSFHTEYSYLYFGRVSIEVHVPFEEAKAAYPSYSIALIILFLLWCYAAVDLLLKLRKAYGMIKLRLASRNAR